jgi:SAM-dependent methyltransferase
MAGVKPFSTEFGYERGQPIDRYYIERFLEEVKDTVRGKVLEIGGDDYTLQYGGSNLQESHVLHVHADNPKATIVGDLTSLPHVPGDVYDCIILTQTLHLIYDFRSALGTCYRLLKPGGSLLLTTPGITPVDHGEWKDTWFWSFTQAAVQKMLEEHFKPEGIDLQYYGNVMVATSFLYGQCTQELNEQDLLFKDPYYPVTITAKATKMV